MTPAQGRRDLTSLYVLLSIIKRCSCTAVDAFSYRSLPPEALEHSLKAIFASFRGTFVCSC
jgi:hypothetical protein